MKNPDTKNDYRSRISRLKGTPFEMGFAAGRALGPRLEANIDRYIRECSPPEAADRPEKLRAGALPWLRALPARFREEAEGLAEGAGVPLQRVAEWNYIEELLDAECSGAVARLGGRAWVVRNNDTYVPEAWGYATIREPAGRIPTVSFGMEGDLFTPTGINRERLWLHYNFLSAWDRAQAGEPRLPGYVFLVEALETCRSLGELETLLGRIPRSGGMLLFAVDGKTDEFALYECPCRGYARRDPAGDWIVGTNHCLVHPGAPPPDGEGPLSTVNRFRRMESLVADLADRRGVGSPVADLIRILADDGIERRTNNLITAYSNVACPSTGEIWYTFGGWPSASRGDWQKMEWPW